MTTPGPFVRVCSSAHVVTTRSPFFCLSSVFTVHSALVSMILGFFYGFQSSLMVFRGSWLIFIFFHGIFIVFHSSCLVFMVFQEHKKCWKIWGRGSPSARYKQSLHCLLGSSTHFVNTLWLFYSLCVFPWVYSAHMVLTLLFSFTLCALHCILRQYFVDI